MKPPTQEIRFGQLPLEQIAQKCAEATEHFFHNRAHDDCYCFEIFRRAFVDGNQRAWELVFSQYRTLMTSWVQAHSQFVRCGEEEQYFVNGALMNMAKACTGEKFGRFPNLPALLSYLKSCVHTAIYNYVRDRSGPQLVELPDSLTSRADSPEREVVTQTQREECWRLINVRLQNERERLVLEHCFIFGLKPRKIYDLYPNKFANVREIYRMKRNILDRLSRDPDLKKFYAEQNHR
ncbi:hypothetical protein KFU94_28555 [Chloroflexi bacterium TSY]|nr:hypothetical protein [Chloroflexi bacterium TSY]